MPKYEVIVTANVIVHETIIVEAKNENDLWARANDVIYDDALRYFGTVDVEKILSIDGIVQEEEE